MKTDIQTHKRHMCTHRERGTEEVKMATRRSEVAGSGRGLPLKGPKQKNNRLDLLMLSALVFGCQLITSPHPI